MATPTSACGSPGAAGAPYAQRFDHSKIIAALAKSADPGTVRMIRVLHNWQELGENVIALQREGLPLHETPQKNFDHFVLREALAGLDEDAAIVDLGCGHTNTLCFLHALGFSNLRGIDLEFDRRIRAKRALLMLRERSLRPPYRLVRGDLTHTSLRSASQDVVVSISTIEHGVDIEQFLAEAARLLRSGGLLFVTTDYWENKIDTDGAQAFGLPWQIFSREQVIAMLCTARRFGLLPAESDEIPGCEDKPVIWQGRRYTFVAMLFRKCPLRR